MFNQEFKQEFVKRRERKNALPKNQLNRLFKKAEKFEEEYNKDVCNFTEEQILDMYKSFGLTSYESILSMNSQFSIYAQYCMEHNLVTDGQNHYYNVTQDQMYECINKNIIKQKIITREQIIKWNGTVRNASDYFVILALFEGLSGQDYKEITRLSINDIDKDKRIVHTCLGRDIPISAELLSVAIESNDTLVYYGLKKIIPLVDNGLIIKDAVQKRATIDDEYRNGRILYTRLKRTLNELTGTANINGKDIIVSGQLYFILEYCKANNIEPKDFIYNKETRMKLDKRFNTQINLTIFWKKYGEYLEAQSGI